MIVMGLLALVSGLINLVFGWFTLPNFSGTDAVIEWVSDLFSNGASLISLFIHKEWWLTALGILVFLMIADKLWHILWWIIRKIPFISIH